ncbi:MAG: hypothetical protein ISS93_02965 [Candidatus Aenigmarchaeota archaeon]|nr:hypothetical protein [Candidatus Aenigmarchaeota archaeon]
MADIIDILINILCQQGTSGKCSSFISAYPDITQQLVWLVFFPAVFLLLFVFFISEGVTKDAKKYRTLLSIAIFIFVIFQGWYHYALTISKYWFIGVIILGGIYVIIHKMGAAGGGGGSGGGGGGSSRPLKALGSHISKRTMATFTGEEKDINNNIKTKFSLLEGIKNDLKNIDPKSTGGTRALPDLKRDFETNRADCERLIESLAKLRGIEFGDKVLRRGDTQIKGYKDRLTKLVKDIENLYAKDYKKAA